MAYRPYRRNQSARGRRSRRSSAPRRTVHWYRSVSNVMDTLTLGPDVIDLLPDTVLDPGARLGATVTRIHLRLDALWVGSQAQPPGFNFFIGIYVGPAATTTPPRPGADANTVDWMFWQQVPPINASTFVIPEVTGPPVVPAMYKTAYEFDIKSQRRFYEPTDKIWLVGETYLNQGIQASFEPMFTASVLIKR